MKYIIFVFYLNKDLTNIVILFKVITKYRYKIHLSFYDNTLSYLSNINIFN